MRSTPRVRDNFAKAGNSQKMAEGLCGCCRLSSEVAGITDLSSLGSYSIHSQLRIGPRFHLAEPLGVAFAGAVDLEETLVQYGQRFKRVEATPGALRFVQNPVPCSKANRQRLQDRAPAG